MGVNDSHSTRSHAADPQLMECAACLHVFDMPLTDTLTAPVCPNCGHVGDREVGIDYPMGAMAGRMTPDRAAKEVTLLGLVWQRIDQLPPAATTNLRGERTEHPTLVSRDRVLGVIQGMVAERVNPTEAWIASQGGEPDGW